MYNPQSTCIYQIPGESCAELPVNHGFNKTIIENAKADYGTSVACICQKVDLTWTHRLLVIK